MYTIKLLNTGTNGYHLIPESQESNIYKYCAREYKGAIWKEGTSLNDDFFCLCIGSNYKDHTTVNRNGEVYHASGLNDFLLNASQELVDVFNARLGLFIPDGRKKRFDWDRCLILWKDSFFRIANPEIMSMEDMLFLYLNVIAINCQDGVGMIDGYSIADYATFRHTANPEIIDAVNHDIEQRKACPTVWARLKHYRDKQLLIREGIASPYFPEDLLDLPHGQCQQVTIQFFIDESTPANEYVHIERTSKTKTSHE